MMNGILQPCVKNVIARREIKLLMNLRGWQKNYDKNMKMLIKSTNSHALYFVLCAVLFYGGLCDTFGSIAHNGGNIGMCALRIRTYFDTSINASHTVRRQKDKYETQNSKFLH